MLVYVQQFEEPFVRRKIEKADKADKERPITVESTKKGIVALKRRDEWLDRIFKRTYEDMVSGRISEARFDTLYTLYEKEQANIKRKILMLADLVENGEEQEKELKQLLTNVRKYTDPEELTLEMLNDLVDKIVVHAPYRKDKRSHQQIDVYYHGVGIVYIPTAEEREEMFEEHLEEVKWEREQEVNIKEKTA